MAKFECKHTGCVYEWTDEQTIIDMRKHSEYRELVPVLFPVPVVAVVAAVAATKPKKAKE